MHQRSWWLYATGFLRRLSATHHMLKAERKDNGIGFVVAVVSFYLHVFCFENYKAKAFGAVND